MYPAQDLKNHPDVKVNDAKVGTETEVVAPAVTGFSAEAIDQQVVAATGTVVTVNYLRNTYKVTYNTNGGSYVASQVGKYGENKELYKIGSPATEDTRLLICGKEEHTHTYNGINYYGNYYGGDDGEIIFSTNNKKLDNILIIGESYDNAILKLLEEKFKTTISIDLRNYNHYMKKDFDFDYYVKKYKIDKVLFIGNVDFYTMSQFMINN